MSDVIKIVEECIAEYEHIDSSVHALTSLREKLVKVSETGYLGDLYRTDYIVEGRGPFPIDMLRYTCSWPKGESDVRQIEDSLEHGGPSDAFSITLTKHHRDPAPNLSYERWKIKFRWNVLRTIETVRL